ncbi:FixH family protein [Pedobacter cryotolerans]|uniref:Nitrogen fixation protein FixH n=1 Tax=Pedobacter cryotolerans TaxID=2571270 RepID=A0A4U1C210_9SPHI|nr:FixH family protein [Pedobacter cryotolerans]TKB97130.1 hypothetical protein FA045_17230 [Pedobacter cryotolerans]
MNWGTKIVLGMIVFMLFIIGMVVYMFKIHGNDNLVDEDYYEKGINYNDEYNANQNVITDKAEPKITISDSQIIIQLKDSANYNLKLARPSTKKDKLADSGATVSDAHLIIINRQNMHSGVWYLELKWISNAKKYQLKKSITL